jgi:hypothetical protein
MNDIFYSFGMCKEGIVSENKTSTFCGTPGKQLLTFFVINFL